MEVKSLTDATLRSRLVRSGMSGISCAVTANKALPSLLNGMGLRQPPGNGGSPGGLGLGHFESTAQLRSSPDESGLSAYENEDGSKVLLRFRFGDLEDAARVCGGRGTYANRLEWRGSVVSHCT